MDNLFTAIRWALSIALIVWIATGSRIALVIGFSLLFISNELSGYAIRLMISRRSGGNS